MIQNSLLKWFVICLMILAISVTFIIVRNRKLDNNSSRLVMLLAHIAFFAGIGTVFTAFILLKEIGLHLYVYVTIAIISSIIIACVDSKSSVASDRERIELYKRNLDELNNVLQALKHGTYSDDDIRNLKEFTMNIRGINKGTISKHFPEDLSAWKRELRVAYEDLDYPISGPGADLFSPPVSHNEWALRLMKHEWNTNLNEEQKERLIQNCNNLIHDTQLYCNYHKKKINIRWVKPFVISILFFFAIYLGLFMGLFSGAF